MNKVIIAGSRDFSDYPYLRSMCDRILTGIPNIEIVSGTAKGADALGERYARDRGHGLRTFEPNWDDHDKAAGPIRNQKMAKYAQICIVFWDGESKGSKDMIKKALNNELELHIFQF